MNILAIKTDSQNARLIILNNKYIIDDYTWEAGRGLAKELPQKIDVLLKKSSIEKIDGFIGFLGPGSFTGLRIGLSAINAMAYYYNVPIVGINSDKWLGIGVERLINNENDKVLIPSYGADANITKPRK